MRFVLGYLILYYLLLTGAVVALWQAGVLAQIPVIWTALVLLFAIGLGGVLAVTSIRPPVSSE